jgi:hypothetical protein
MQAVVLSDSEKLQMCLLSLKLRSLCNHIGTVACRLPAKYWLWTTPDAK